MQDKVSEFTWAHLTWAAAPTPYGRKAAPQPLDRWLPDLFLSFPPTFLPILAQAPACHLELEEKAVGMHVRRNPVCERKWWRQTQEGHSVGWECNPGSLCRITWHSNFLGACPAPDTVPFNPYINPHLQLASHCCFCSKLIYWHRFKHWANWHLLLFKQHLLPHQRHLTKFCPVFKSHFKHYLSEDLPAQFSELFFPTFTLPRQLSPTWHLLCPNSFCICVRSAASLGAPQKQHLMSLHSSCGSCGQQAFNICRITHTAAILSLLPPLQEKDRQPSPMPGTITILRKPHFAFFLARPHNSWALGSLTKDWSQATEVKAWNPNH